ncbi:phytoene desaturase family protein [Paeniglutamicibacter cryotolerans]|uniref:Pyridine nucleotide-disulfide oxidoreductase domain-containing protein 2 n=1 Tax=Paeniglutamicibacter cryotolerans TaxID=670079 RepID=A0A839QW34_9MICC|nr:NAD(P)/FAD-dependent oxidoreductase [Paeniglutamicibacter cryotolerans]MBB2996221.1 phytoene dehydrogenase-like protein [Paeniglutamicibacter cryotolerans]
MDTDYVVIGSGINALVAAVELARSGASVTLLEEREKLGGFIGSAELTVPGFIHDTFSSWHPLFVAGAAYAELGAELHARGLQYLNTEDTDTPWVCASVGTDSRGNTSVVLAQRDPQATAAAFGQQEDGAAYARMLDDLGAQAPVVFGTLGGEMDVPTLSRLGLKTLRMGLVRAQELARQALMSGRNLTRSRFRGTEVDQLWAPWLLHAGIGPEQASGGVMLPVMAATMHQFGLPVVKGGAAGFVTAFESLLRDHGVVIRTGTRAESIEVREGRAVAVNTPEGSIRARKGILASVSVPELYGELLKAPDLAPGVAEQAATYRPGRAAMQIHVALAGPVPWTDQRLAHTPLIHVSSGSDSTAIACAQAEAGLLPGNPTIVVGQQCVLDPSRAPAGQATLWLQLQELPYEPSGDAAGFLDTSKGWDEQLVSDYTDRVLDKIEVYAPGLRALVRGIRAISPWELSKLNRNAVGGDPYGGAVELYQNLLWRPLPRMGRGRSPVKDLWHIGAATHPGPGLGGGSGHLVAQRLIRRAKRPGLRKSTT